jgi:hypothetical protein
MLIHIVKVSILDMEASMAAFTQGLYQPEHVTTNIIHICSPVDIPLTYLSQDYHITFITAFMSTFSILPNYYNFYCFEHINPHLKLRTCSVNDLF